MKTYSAYKESGIKWLGDIPEHWGMTTVGRMSYLGRGRVISNIEIGENPGDFPVYSSQTANNGIMGHLDSYDFEGEYVTWTTDGANAGTVFYRSGKFNCTNVCGTIQPKTDKVFLPYIPYLLNLGTKYYVRYDINPKLMNGEMAQINICLPPVPEQKAIADFLDRKTAQIDTLIEKKQRQIALLEEQRTALINQAVTKGLDPNVPMKDTGIEWLGEIRKHWEVTKIKRVVNVIDGDRGKEYPNQDDFIDLGIPFLSSKNIIDNKFDFNKLRFISREKFERLGRGKLTNGDLVITVRGTIGSVGHFVGNEYETAFINAQMMIMRPSENLSSTFFYYLARSNYWFTQLDYSAYGAAQQQLSNVILQNLSIALPPHDEQKIIEQYLDRKTNQFDKTTYKIQAEIELLQEYRTALISAAVTGKIDVRTEL